ncbi:MAG: hypothetical protein U0165_06605 [Polyangiaceae bacterium]
MGGLPTGASGVALIPKPAWAGSDYNQGFLVTYRNSPQVDLVRYIDDCASSPTRPFLSGPVTTGINTNASGFDSRSIIVDADKRQSCEASCGDGDVVAFFDLCRSAVEGVRRESFSGVAARRRNPPRVLSLAQTARRIYRNRPRSRWAHHGSTRPRSSTRTAISRRVFSCSVLIRVTCSRSTRAS